MEDDAFGAVLLDAIRDPDATFRYLIERDDGFLDVIDMNSFAPVRKWAAVERRGLRFIRGRVLDVGCGPGRVALELEARGHDVVGIDPSPGAIEVARLRGVGDVREMRFEDVDPTLGKFGTALFYGNNFGLFGARNKARSLLRMLRPMADRIVATSNDPYRTKDPVHLAYHERNRHRHRMPGQARIRVRYRDLAGPWFDYLLVSPQEMEEIVEGTGWHIERIIEDEGSFYVAVLS